MQFTVTRSEWIRGGYGTSGLYVKKGKRGIGNPNHKRCCLGFFANACGIPDDQLMHSFSPANLSSEDPSFPAEWIALIQNPHEPPEASENTDLCKKLMSCNDDPELNDAEREGQLTVLFAELGHTVVFVD